MGKIDSLVSDWERNRKLYIKISKKDFDISAREEAFKLGPICENQSNFMREFGPYNPERVAFGILKSGDRLWCDVNEVSDE